MMEQTLRIEFFQEAFDKVKAAQRAFDSLGLDVQVAVLSRAKRLSRIVLRGPINEKIRAIKVIRAATGLGLKDSKDIVDKTYDHQQWVVSESYNARDIQDIWSRIQEECASFGPDAMHEVAGYFHILED